MWPNGGSWCKGNTGVPRPFLVAFHSTRKSLTFSVLIHPGACVGKAGSPGTEPDRLGSQHGPDPEPFASPLFASILSSTQRGSRCYPPHGTFVKSD